MDAPWDRSFNCRGNRERLPWSGSVRRTSLDRVADDGAQMPVLRTFTALNYLASRGRNGRGDIESGACGQEPVYPPAQLAVGTGPEHEMEMFGFRQRPTTCIGTRTRASPMLRTKAPKSSSLWNTSAFSLVRMIV